MKNKRQTENGIHLLAFLITGLSLSMLFVCCSHKYAAPPPPRVQSAQDVQPVKKINFSSDDMPYEEGKCFSLCLFRDLYDTTQHVYTVYNGSPDDTNVETYEEEVIIKPAMTRLVKKKVYKHCLSADPNDCFVWCLIEQPEEKITLQILKDTLQTSNYEIKTVEIINLVREGGFTEWREVVCHENITADLVRNLQSALTAKGYDPGLNSDIMNNAITTALVQYQQDHGLPVGQLDFETLHYLGIRL